MPSMAVRTVVAVDGSAAGNPGPGGWSWFVSPTCWAAGGVRHTTNNRMELTAVIEALRNVDPGTAVEFVCDSRYVVDAATRWRFQWKKRGWRKADGGEVANADLVRALDGLLGECRQRGQRVEFTWVRGHDGHPLNEQADRRARAAAVAVRDGKTVGAGPGWVDDAGS